jgi:hypothetical protein
MLTLFATLQGQTKKASTPATEIASIDRYTAQLDQFAKRNQKSAQVLGDISSASTDEKSNWKKFKSTKEREDAGTGDNLNEQADVWKREGKVVATNMTFGSPSGDWAHFVTYYFRDDGSVAKIHGELNTFYGDLRVVSDHYYSQDGKLLKTKRLFLDLKTKRPKKPGDYQPKKSEPVYKKVSDLPFFKLL